MGENLSVSFRYATNSKRQKDSSAERAYIHHHPRMKRQLSSKHGTRNDSSILGLATSAACFFLSFQLSCLPLVLAFQDRQIGETALARCLELDCRVKPLAAVATLGRGTSTWVWGAAAAPGRPGVYGGRGKRKVDSLGLGLASRSQLIGE